jgi:hypothetical protein
MDCRENLCQCPFCRSSLPMKKKPRPVRFFTDDMPRSERRQWRRFLKLQLHEIDRAYNRIRSFSM